LQTAGPQCRAVLFQQLPGSQHSWRVVGHGLWDKYAVQSEHAKNLLLRVMLTTMLTGGDYSAIANDLIKPGFFWINPSTSAC